MRLHSLIVVWLVGGLVGLTGCLDHGRNKCTPIANEDFAPALQLRNPDTGQCEVFDAGPPCDSRCGPCPDIGIALPDWAQCFGPCEGLLEAACLANATCHASYKDGGAAAPTFAACFELPPSGAITGACTNLDAQRCSEHTDCITVYSAGPGTPSFTSCVAEVMPVACSTLTTEAACKGRTDCDPVYTGTNCTCDHNGCTCATETFKSCQSL